MASPKGSAMVSRIRRVGAVALFVSAVILTLTMRAASGAAPVVDAVRVDGIIGRASARYVQRRIDRAAHDDAQALVVAFDSPGRLMKSMDDLTEAMLNSPVPIDGRTVRTAAGTRRLATRNARTVEIPMDVTEHFLSLVRDPNAGFILMTIAIYGLVLELSAPGAVFPGVIGGLALVLACVSFAAVTVNVAGLLLIAFALILFIADIKMPSHGVLTSGGIASFAFGSLLLTGENEPLLRISVTLILTVTALTAAFFAFAVGAGVRAQGRRVQTGREALIGAIGTTRSDLAPLGTVFLLGELWKAETAFTHIPARRRVRVVGVSGLLLDVRAADVPRKEG